MRGLVQPRRRELVIEPPSDIVGARLSAIRPPRIMHGFRADQLTKSVVIACGQKRIEPRALFGQEAAVLLIAAPVFEINLLMGDVKVAAKHQFAFAFAQPLAMLQRADHFGQRGQQRDDARGWCGG